MPQESESPSAWQIATVTRIVEETYRVKTFTLRLPKWRPFRSGQHVDVRLTAPDGYQAQRSYSIASPPEREGEIDLTIELVPEGEVSHYFHKVVEAGDGIELRGPIGGPFTWTRDMGGPLFLVGGGSGIVPLMSMLRHRQLSATSISSLLLYSSRSLEDVIYRRELERVNSSEAGPTVVHTLTRSHPPSWSGYTRRVDRAMLADSLDRLDGPRHAYVCGPNPLVETVARSLVDLGLPVERIHTERFGPSG